MIPGGDNPGNIGRIAMMKAANDRMKRRKAGTLRDNERPGKKRGHTKTADQMAGERTPPVKPRRKRRTPEQMKADGAPSRAGMKLDPNRVKRKYTKRDQ